MLSKGSNCGMVESIRGIDLFGGSRGTNFPRRWASYLILEVSYRVFKFRKKEEKNKLTFLRCLQCAKHCSVLVLFLSNHFQTCC